MISYVLREREETPEEGAKGPGESWSRAEPFPVPRIGGIDNTRLTGVQGGSDRYVPLVTLLFECKHLVWLTCPSSSLWMAERGSYVHR